MSSHLINSQSSLRRAPVAAVALVTALAWGAVFAAPQAKALRPDVDMPGVIATDESPAQDPQLNMTMRHRQMDAAWWARH